MNKEKLEQLLDQNVRKFTTLIKSRDIKEVLLDKWWVGIDSRYLLLRSENIREV